MEKLRAVLCRLAAKSAGLSLCASGHDHDLRGDRLSVLLQHRAVALQHVARRFRNWQIVGLQNYVEVLTDPNLWSIFAKTIVWTVVNVAFHVGLGPDAGRRAQRPGPRQDALPHPADHSLGGAGVHHRPHLARHVRLRIRRGQPDAGTSRTVSADRVAAGLLHLTPPVNWLGDVAPRLSGVHRRQCLARFPVHDGHRARRHAGHSRRAVRGGAHRPGVAVATVSAHHAADAEAGAAAGDHAGHDLDVQQPERHLARLERRRAAGLDAHSGVVRL